ALEMMLPYVGERVVTLEDPADAALLVEATGRNAPTAALRSAGRRQLEALDAGGCVLLARGAGAGLVPMSALRTQNAVNLYINDLMVPALREVCGLPPLARAEEAPASSGVAALLAPEPTPFAPAAAAGDAAASLAQYPRYQQASDGVAAAEFPLSPSQAPLQQLRSTSALGDELDCESPRTPIEQKWCCDYMDKGCSPPAGVMMN
ncbi:unnamed protein product, partial [Prorocentrum cordatum]